VPALQVEQTDLLRQVVWAEYLKILLQIMEQLGRLLVDILQVAVAVEILRHNLAESELADREVAALARQQELLQLQEQ
jgi:hypothetical protein